jgi:hypothetical protein
MELKVIVNMPHPNQMHQMIRSLLQAVQASAMGVSGCLGSILELTCAQPQSPETASWLMFQYPETLLRLTTTNHLSLCLPL